MAQKKWRGIFAVAGAAVVHLTLGTIYTFGNMSPYIASYMRMYTTETLMTTAQMVWVYAATLVCQGSLMSVGGLLEKRIGPQLTALLGCVFMSSGVTLTYFSVKHSFSMVVLTYGVMYGVGISAAYISLISAGMKWYPENRGVVNGVIVGGFGLGAFIFNQIQTAFLNPENCTPDSNGYFTDSMVLERVPRVFILLGSIYGVTQLIGCFFIRRAPHINLQETEPLLKSVIGKSTTIDLVQVVRMDDDGIMILLDSSKSSSSEHLTPWQMLQTREFYLLYLTMFCLAQTVNFTNAMYKAFGQTFIFDDYVLALIGAISAIFNAGGRIMWGLVIDRYSYKLSMQCLSLLVILFLLTMPLTVWGGAYMFGAWICGLYLSISGIFVLIPTCVANQFGVEHMGVNYGIVFSNVAFGAPLTAIITQSLTEALGYTGMFYILAVFAALGFALTLPFREAKYR